MLPWPMSARFHSSLRQQITSSAPIPRKLSLTSNPSTMNTCKRSSKQTTLTTFRITTFCESHPRVVIVNQPFAASILPSFPSATPARSSASRFSHHRSIKKLQHIPPNLRQSKQSDFASNRPGHADSPCRVKMDSIVLAQIICCVTGRISECYNSGATGW